MTLILVAGVTLTQLYKRYPQARGEAVAVVKGISLEVRDREFMVFVGPSGCGKSTTLRMIAGLEEVSAGSIAIDGREVANVAPKDRDIAMVFQNYALYPHMSVYENMAFGLKMRGVDRLTVETRVREASAMLGLDPYLQRRPKDLSGGQRQRVAVGRAIVRKPKVFLFDEPLSNLDAKMRVSTRMEIMRLHRQLEATMIYVTHDQVEAMTMGDRICVMKDGEIMQVATPLELYRKPANLFVAGFIGSPPMNLWPGRVGQQASVSRFDSDVAIGPRFALPRSLPARMRVVVGVRPEAIRLGSAAGVCLRGQLVDRVEHMGAEALVYTSTEGFTAVVRTESSVQLRAGEAVDLSFDLGAAQLFDEVSGKRCFVEDLA